MTLAVADSTAAVCEILFGSANKTRGTNIERPASCVNVSCNLLCSTQETYRKENRKRLVVPGRRTDKHRQAQNWHSISPELFIFHCLAGEQRSAMAPAGANLSGC